MSSRYPRATPQDLEIHRKKNPSDKPCHQSAPPIKFDDLSPKDLYLHGIAGLASVTNDIRFGKCGKELLKILLDDDAEVDGFQFGAVPYL